MFKNFGFFKENLSGPENVGAVNWNAGSNTLSTNQCFSLALVSIQIRVKTKIKIKFYNLLHFREVKFTRSISQDLKR
jgi:hypothetical protein